jgi:transposase
MAAAPWIVSDELWELVEPLLPKKVRRFQYPGRKRLPDRQALQGILFVLHTGIAWQHLTRELGFGSGVTCWRRLDEWQRAGAAYDHDKYGRLVWERGIKPVIARRQTEHGSGLGRYRWVVERTFAWLHNFKRLLIRYERRAASTMRCSPSAAASSLPPTQQLNLKMPSQSVVRRMSASMTASGATAMWRCCAPVISSTRHPRSRASAAASL